jgi:simple sugar transport system ATP-binding protein
VKPAIAAPPVTAGVHAPAVALRGVTKRFPGVVANDNVDFEARRGEVHALLGENGAGKSTLSNIITGLYRPDEGDMAIDGERVELRSPRDALTAGIFMVHQHFRLVTPFTVAENVLLGHHDAGDRSIRVHPRAVEARVAELSQRYRMPVDPKARIWQLSVGEQQRVEILKALFRDARILILDEPTAVLTPQESEVLFETLRQMAAEGRTVIFISHKLDEVLAVADRITVLRDARAVGTVEAAGTTTRDLARMMVGREVVFTRKNTTHERAHGEPVLQVSDVSAKGDRGEDALSAVSIDVHAGEIVGVAGVAGNGQRELAGVITGARSRTAGAVTVCGKALRGSDPREAIHLGIAHVPEDRLGTGLASSLPISDNLVLKSYRRPPMSSPPFLRRRRIDDNAEDLMARFDVRAPGPSTPTRLLSGGNVQKVLLAREFSCDPKVLVAASPTRGLDVGAIETVRGLLLDAASRGVGVLLISEDLDEVLALSDRIVVMFEGRVAGVVEADGADVEEIGLLMAGASP